LKTQHVFVWSVNEICGKGCLSSEGEERRLQWERPCGADGKEDTEEETHMQRISAPAPRRAGSKVVAALGLIVGAVALASPAAAQEEAVTQGLAVWKRAGCAACHGTFAQGGGGGEQPAGPSLRDNRALTAEIVNEVVRCGRPGSQMPYFLAGAYTEVACYGLPVGPPPAGTQRSTALPAADVEKLVAYLSGRILGKGNTISRAECGLYYGDPGHPNCGQYR
jgi:mono/diheme cytochrome c family protein